MVIRYKEESHLINKFKIQQYINWKYIKIIHIKNFCISEHLHKNQNTRNITNFQNSISTYVNGSEY